MRPREGQNGAIFFQEACVSNINRGMTYADAGVSIAAGAALVDRIKPAVVKTSRSGVMGALGGFGALFDLKAVGYDDPVLVAGTDGVGTKLRVGAEMGVLNGLGVDLVAMCVNDLVCQGAEPLFFLDYFATGKLDTQKAATIIEGIAEACCACGAALIGGETAETPGLYAAGDFDIAGFAVGAVERGQILPRATQIGDIVLGLASDGAHANGFSLIRKIVSLAALEWCEPAPFEPDRSLGEALATPTRLYVRSLLSVLRDRDLARGVRALAHITGGGLSENIPRVIARGQTARIDLGTWKVPPLFRWLRERGNVQEDEMLRTFNCGIGMAAIVDPEAADAVANACSARGETVFKIGEIADSPNDVASVTYSGLLFS
jgi:phosphoribosylformylglycinamidine cyclo-ligase